MKLCDWYCGLLEQLGGEAQGIFCGYPLSADIDLPFCTLEIQKMQWKEPCHQGQDCSYQFSLILKATVFGAWDADIPDLLEILEDKIISPMLDLEYRIREIIIENTNYNHSLHRMVLEGAIILEGMIQRREQTST